MKKILVIEDEPLVRSNILELLEAEDFQVVSAENGFVGTLWALEHSPDLIICDVMIPEINGHEVLRLLRQDPITATIPFIFLTAMADKADIRQGMNLGADDYLTKPFTRAELLAAVSSQLAKQATLSQQYNNEHQRVESLQRQVQALEQQIEQKDKRLQAFQQQLYKAISKVNTALSMLKKVESESLRDRYLEMIKEACAEEIYLLKNNSSLEHLLSAENIEFLNQLNLNPHSD